MFGVAEGGAAIDAVGDGVVDVALQDAGFVVITSARP